MRVFTEEQRFDQWWFRALMLLAFATIVFAIVATLPEIDTESIEFWVLLVSMAITIPVMVMITFYMRLDTKIDEQGVHYGFKPFHLSFKLIPWHDITECYVRKYSPIGEYGGWGYRMIGRRNGKALNVTGNIGIQLVFKNNKRLLIGTQKEDDAKRTIETYKHKI